MRHRLGLFLLVLFALSVASFATAVAVTMPATIPPWLGIALLFAFAAGVVAIAQYGESMLAWARRDEAE